jgi:hypothetical protein
MEKRIRAETGGYTLFLSLIGTLDSRSSMVHRTEMRMPFRPIEAFSNRFALPRQVAKGEPWPKGDFHPSNGSAGGETTQPNWWEETSRSERRRKTMKARARSLLGIFASCLCGLGLQGFSLVAAAQLALPPGAKPHLCESGEALSAVTAHTAQRGGPYINICDGHALASRFASSEGGEAQLEQAVPVAMASGDFDEDGVPDLVSGFARGEGGALTVHRGNVHALWPYGEAIRNGPPPAFLPEAQVFDLPEAPDFLGVGDFNADGHWDIVAARRGGTALYFLLGDGRGGFAAAQRVELPGNVTAMTTGEINRADGLTDIVVGVTGEHGGDQGSQALVFESPMGAMRAAPEIIKAPSEITALALGRLDGGVFYDLAIGAGRQLMIVHGRDRMLTLGKLGAGRAKAANIQQQTLPFAVLDLAVGSFSGMTNLAALGDDGAVHLLENAHAVANLARMANHPFSTAASSRGGGKRRLTQSASLHGGRLTRSQILLRAAAKRELVLLKSGKGAAAEWTARGSVTLPQSVIASRDRSFSRHLVAAHISGAPTEDLLVVDRSASQIHVLSNSAEWGSERRSLNEDNIASEVMTHVTSFDTAGAPAAVLPMRLNKHPLQSLVMLTEGQTTPSIALSEPAYTITVTNTQDSAPGSGPDGSLRAAVTFVNGSFGIPGEITFDIPLSDPNCDQITHVCTIRPLSQSVPGSGNDAALPNVFAPVTIDGYTQPGASPNTLPGGDNAVILIRVEGSMATTPGGEGFQIFEVPATIRGFDIAEWADPDYVSDPGYAVGAIAIDMEGVAGFAEGNFLGTSAQGTFATTVMYGSDATPSSNEAGVFVGNGPLLGTSALGNVVGGTTPQARNLISYNLGDGVLVYPEGTLTQIQGNFIGTDNTGTQGLQNGVDGVLIVYLVVVGGAQPGAGNVISESADFNINVNGTYGPTGNLIQGNFIGTDVTGTKAIGGGGVDINLNQTSSTSANSTVGGTTPAARNVISGNRFAGVTLDSAFNNLVAGNYIGVDVSGTKALPNKGGGISSGDAELIDSSTGKPHFPIFPAALNIIGGAVAGASNVISGNTTDGISIAGSFYTDAYSTYQGNTILGNLIGTDAGGTSSVPNTGNGVHFITATVANDPNYGTLAPTLNVIGGTEAGMANVISNNGGDGVLMEAGTLNKTVGNTIHNNKGAGVHLLAAADDDLISRNSIFGNGALGIQLGSGGPNINTACQATITGANNQQNAPVMTAGTGSTFLSATATDPNGNTSQFSNTVNVSGSQFTAIGTFNGLPNTAFTIEYFSSPSADASGYGQGDTYLGSSTVTSTSNCSAPINNPINTDDADMDVSLAATTLYTGTQFGKQAYTSTVTNNGSATAHNVVWTDTFPSSLSLINTAQASCVSPVTTTAGSCTVKGQAVTCDLGVMPAGATASITIPVETSTTGSVFDTANVTATETDPDLANNTATVTVSSKDSYPMIDHLTPYAVIAGSPDLPLMIYGVNFLPTTTVEFNGTALDATYYSDQGCNVSYPFIPPYCAMLQVTVPAAMIATAGDATITVTNGTQSYSNDFSAYIQGACKLTVDPPALAVPYYGVVESLYTYTNAPSCSWNASSAVPWINILDSDLASGGSRMGNSPVDFAIEPDTGASRSGTYTQAGTPMTFQQTGGSTCTYTLKSNPTTFSSAAGTGTIDVTASDSSCLWSATQYASWITNLKQSTNTGSGTVSYSVSANTGGSRTGSVLIESIGGAGTVFTVNQNEADSCYFTLTSDSDQIPTAGGSDSFGVVASKPSCAWKASLDTTDATFATITSGKSGTGNGTVKFTLAPNTSSGRTASITVGNTSGSSQIFSAIQVSANVCDFTITPNTVNISDQGGTNTIPLIPTYSFCTFAAQSNNPALLLQTTSGTYGTEIPYTVAQNTGPARILTATVGCQKFTVNQGGAGTGNPVPAITTLKPASTPVSEAGLTLTVNGKSFVKGATVLFNGVPRVTTFVSATQVTAALLAIDIDTVSSATITVSNPVPGGGVSNAVAFNITGKNLVPKITTLQPATAVAGSPGFTLTVNGSNFTAASVASFAGTARTTTYVSPTQLTISVASADVAASGKPAVVVTNPAPGGGQSNSVAFSVTSPSVTITALSPTSVAAGSGELVLSVEGSGFLSGATVNFAGAAEPTEFVDVFFLIAVVPASAVASPGTYAVTVTNPGKGGSISNSVHFTVTGTGNPTPTVTTLNPASATAGGAALTLTVNGTNFIKASSVKFSGKARTTTYVSATKLTVAILSSDIAKAGKPGVTVTNPTPGGGTSNSVAFPVNNPAPTISKLKPASTEAGGAAFTLTVDGTGFNADSKVTFKGESETTKLVSATELTAAIAAKDISAAGSVPVSVMNPAPGGGTAAAIQFNIVAPKKTPTVKVTPSSSRITTAQSLTVKVDVSGGSGTPTGSVKLTSGGYTSAPAKLSGGGAMIDVAAGSLAVGTDKLTVSYTPDSASSSTYDSATGSNIVTVTPPAKITPTITVSPSPSSITTKQALTVMVAVSGGNGNPVPIGSVTLTSGSYASAATDLSSGGATINIPAGSLPVGTDTLVVSYTPDSASSTTYNSATGSNTVAVTTPAKTTPKVNVSPASSSITTAQALSVKVGVTGNPTPTGSVKLSSGSYSSASAKLSGGSASIDVPAGSLATGTDTLIVTYTPDAASSSTYNSSTGSSTVTVAAATVQATVGTTPAGLSFTVDGVNYTSTRVLSWTVGSSHTIATTSPQTSSGTQNKFASWSDDGAISHAVTAPSSNANYTATFTTSYQLTTAANPASDGTVSPASDKYYPSGTVVNLLATPNSGFQFSSWSGNVASANSASTTVTMSAPQSVTANFSAIPMAKATLTPASLTFTAAAGATSAAQTATLSNTGNASLAISGITITGADPNDFSQTNNCGNSLAAGSNCYISVTFTPASVASFAATISVADNAAKSPQTVALSGTGTTPPAPIAMLTPTSLSFSSNTGVASAAKVATLANTGNAPLAISGITIAGANPSDFSQTNTCGSSLAASATCAISVTFTPASAASFTATLSVADNASGSPQTTSLSGTGVTPAADFGLSSPTSPQTIAPGAAAKFVIDVSTTPSGDTFGNAVTLSASGLPPNATATFSPANVTPGASSANSTLTIQTVATAPVTAVNRKPASPWPVLTPSMAVLFGGFGLLFWRRRHGQVLRRLSMFVVLLAFGIGALGVMGCGGGFALTQQSPRPTTYTVLVTGTSGADQHTTTVTLTVQ